MILIAGLGNPGTKYTHNRHNVGFMFVDYFLKFLTKSYELPTTTFHFDKYANAEIAKTELIANSQKLNAILAKPQTFMNRSGESIKKIMTNYKIHLKNQQQNTSPFSPPTSDPLSPSPIFIAHDDLDIQLGKFKIQYGVGPKKHNGLLSIEHHLHSVEYWRIRIGVDNRNGDRTLSGEDYVLQNLSSEEYEIIEQTFPLIAKHLLTNNLPLTTHNS